MTMTPVQSSNVAAVGYDPATKILRVAFKNGGEYEYAGVPAEAHAALLNTDSIGAHLHKHIKPKFAVSRVPGECR